jgi:hypothetical protein
MYRITFIGVLLCFSLPVMADQALMRLFFSPAERALINLKSTSKANDESAAKGADQVVTQTETIEVKGYMQLDSQPAVVWVNQSNTLKSKTIASDVRVKGVEKTGEVKIAVKGKGLVKAKPGQVVTRNKSGAIDVYQTE